MTRSLHRYILRAQNIGVALINSYFWITPTTVKVNLNLSLYVQTGKLRVRCGRCQEGAIVLERDPCDWDDVLQPNRCQHPFYSPSLAKLKKWIHLENKKYRKVCLKKFN